MDPQPPSPRALRLALGIVLVLIVGAIGAIEARGSLSTEPPAAATAPPGPTERPPISIVVTAPSPVVPATDTTESPTTSEPSPAETDTTHGPPGAPEVIPTAPPPPAPPTVILYGDSLAFSARDYFEWRVRSSGWEPVLRVFPGSATCDWFDELEVDLVDHTPQMVVVAFSGNAMTPCMVDPRTDAGYSGVRHTEKYRADTQHFADSITEAGAFAVIVGAPAAAHGGGASLPGVFRDIVASTPGSLYVDGGSTIAPGGVYTPTMPCRPDEGEDLGCAGGLIRVRADDGAHFCPAEPVDSLGPCPVYASGARRYAELMATHVWVA